MDPQPHAPAPSLAEYLYRVSLEDPRRLQLFIGPPLEAGAPEPNLGVLRAFVTGYQEAVGHRDDGFLAWLREEGQYPPEGWASVLLRQAGGDHPAAIGAFFGHLHRFLLASRPPWFVAFNRSPRTSQLWPADGRDLRLPEHVRAVLDD